jgi:hypothetical protein
LGQTRAPTLKFGIFGEKLSHQLHHLGSRLGQPRALGRRVSDEFAVPLCRTHHRELHGRRDEAAWWESVKLDPFILARHLWEHSRLNDAPSHGNISSSVSDVSTPSIPKEEVVQREPDSAGAVFSETADVVDIPQSGNCSGGRAGQSTQGEG